jgi:hypothetical protein
VFNALSRGRMWDRVRHGPPGWWVLLGDLKAAPAFEEVRK